MSSAAPLQAATAKPLQTAGANLILQRKCACGAGASGLTGECTECGKKKLGLQTKLRINEPGDVYEQEADRVADQVLAKPSHPDVSNAAPHIQRYAGQSAGDVKTAPPSVNRVLASPGESLEPALRQDMEQRFGHDFSQVRVHADRNAAQSALNVDAHAYTMGQHIVFSAGRYAPGTSDGMRLIAHELTHVVQQSGAGAGSGSPSGVLQCKPRSDASSAQADVDLAPLQGSEGAPSEADTAQAGAPEAAPVPPPDSAESLGSPPRTDTSVPAAQSPGPQAPPTELDPGAPVSEALDAATDAGTPANATQAARVSAAPVADDSSMPRLTDLLTQPQPQAVAIDPGASPIEIASESVALDEASQDSEVDRGALLGALAYGVGEARTTITSHSTAARAGIDRHAKASREKLKEQTTAADKAVSALAGKRRNQLDEMIFATEKGIRRLETECSEKAAKYAANANVAQTDGFAFYRGILTEAFDKSIQSAETFRDSESDRLKRAIAGNAKEARHKAELYDKRFIRSNTSQSEGRMAVQREAANDVAEAYATEFEKALPDALSGIAKACGDLGKELAKHRVQALVEYDKGLPIVLRGIDEQLDAARQDIAAKAVEARESLAKAAVEMRARIGFLEKTALERNSTFRDKVDGQIESGRAGAEQQFRRAIPQAMKPIGDIVDEAVGMLTTADDALDPDASERFVEEVVDFSLGAADATGTVFDAARDATIGTLGGAVPFARRGFAAGKKDLDATLRAEGAENEHALMKFTNSTRDYLRSSLTFLDETFYAAIQESEKTLRPLVNDLRAQLRESVNGATAEIHQAVVDVNYAQLKALRRLPKEMHNAARQAAWRYDHSILKYVVDVLEVTLGFVLIVAILVAVVVGFVFAFGGIAAALILAAIGGFALGYFGAKAYDERRKAGASRVSALLGAIDEVTGLKEVRRAFTDPKMSPFERGMAWGGFWLSLFGFASGASRFARAIKVRLPAKFTNPFRLKRAPVSVTTPEVPVPAVAAEAPKIGFELPHQKRLKPEITAVPDAPVRAGKRQIGFVSSEKPAPMPDVPEAPVGSGKRQIGFVSSEKPAPTPDVPAAPVGSGKRQVGFVSSEKPAPTPDVPAAPVGSGKRQVGFVSSEKPARTPDVPEAPVGSGKRQIGFVSSEKSPSKPVAPDAPTQPRADVDAPSGKSDPSARVGDSPSVISQMPPAREMPGAQRGGTAGQRADVPTRASANPAATTPRRSAGETPTAGSPTKGAVVSTVEPEVPAAARPATAAPEPPPKSRTSAADEARIAEQEAVEAARTRRVADEARVKKLDEEFKSLEELRKALGRRRKRDYVDDAYDQTKRDLRDAKFNLRKSRQAEAEAEAAERLGRPKPDDVDSPSPMSPDEIKAKALEELKHRQKRVEENNRTIKENEEDLAQARNKVAERQKEFDEARPGNDLGPGGRELMRAKERARQGLDSARKHLKSVEDRTVDARAANQKHYQKMQELDRILHPENYPQSTGEKGTFGESEGHKYMDQQGFKFRGSSQKPHDPTKTKPQGLDGAYEKVNATKPPKHVAAEMKYDESRMRPGQDQHEWVDDRLEDAVGWRHAERMRSEGFEYWVLRYDLKLKRTVPKKLWTWIPSRKRGLYGKWLGTVKYDPLP